jgi:hypothetical protein
VRPGDEERLLQIRPAKFHRPFPVCMPEPDFMRNFFLGLKWLFLPERPVGGLTRGRCRFLPPTAPSRRAASAE